MDYGEITMTFDLRSHLRIVLAAAVAQANTGNRDLTGLCLFDEQRSEMLRPARTRQHLAQLLNRIVDAAGLAPTTGQAAPVSLLNITYALVEEIHPEWLRREVNRVPFFLGWKWPTTRIVLSLFVPFYFLLSLLYSLFFRRTRQEVDRRKRLASALSANYHLGPGGLSLLIEDDQRFVSFAQQYLAEHHVPYPLPFYDKSGRYLFASAEKVQVLASALLRAVHLGQDNELFVLFVDLLDIPEHLAPLERAIRVAVARHHQVMIVCPWPPKLPLPTAEVSELPTSRAANELQPLLKLTTTIRLHRAFHHVRKTFTRLGIPVLCAKSEEPVRLILERLERLRVLGRRR